LDHFRTQLLQQAAQGSSQPARAQVNPLALSLIALLPLGCGSDESKGGFPRALDDASVGGAGSGTGGNGGSSGTGGAAGSAGTGGSAAVDASITDGDGGTAHAIPGQAVLWSTTPCDGDGFIPDLDEGVGVCTKVDIPDRHYLFSWDAQNQQSTSTGDTGDGGTTGILELGFAPDQVLRGADGKYYITHYGNGAAASPTPSGLSVVDNGIAMQNQAPFTQVLLAEPMANSAGNMVLQFTPAFPKGMAQIGDRLFIATSNLVIQGAREANADGGTALDIETHFNPGIVLIYNTASAAWEHYLATTDFNPTSVAAINGKIYVVNSGDVDPQRNPIAITPSSIDVINPQTLQIERNIPLGSRTTEAGDAGPDGAEGTDLDGSSDGAPQGARQNLAAGIQGEIAVSSDGKTMVLPTGDNSGRILVVDVESGTSRTITVATGAKILLTGLTFHPSDQFVYVGNFNDGKIYTVNLRDGQVVDHQSLDGNTTDFSGISDGLWQSASVFMGVGPEIYRLPVQQ
jgi:hypothetical protein